MHFTSYQSQYFAWFLSRRLGAESVDLLASTLVPGGVTQATGWQAGGGFRYYELAPTLLACCGAYRGVTAAQAAQRWPNLTIKKIPKMIKDRCHWGHDDYSLNVANLPMAQKAAAVPSQDDLFGGDAA